jgi:hypothetical protein
MGVLVKEIRGSFKQVQEEETDSNSFYIEGIDIGWVN